MINWLYFIYFILVLVSLVEIIQNMLRLNIAILTDTFQVLFKLTECHTWMPPVDSGMTIKYNKAWLRYVQKFLDDAPTLCCENYQTKLRKLQIFYVGLLKLFKIMPEFVFNCDPDELITLGRDYKA